MTSADVTSRSSRSQCVHPRAQLTPVWDLLGLLAASLSDGEAGWTPEGAGGFQPWILGEVAGDESRKSAVSDSSGRVASPVKAMAPEALKLAPFHVEWLQGFLWDECGPRLAVRRPTPGSAADTTAAPMRQLSHADVGAVTRRRLTFTVTHKSEAPRMHRFAAHGRSPPVLGHSSPCLAPNPENAPSAALRSFADRRPTRDPREA